MALDTCPVAPRIYVDSFQTRCCQYFKMGKKCKHDTPTTCEFPAPAALRPSETGRQLTLTATCKVSRRQRTSFLSLPPTVRNTVYLEAGIIFSSETSETVDLDFERGDSWVTTEGYALLRVCRQVHDEVEAIIYSQPVFIAPRDTDSGMNLQCLRNLNPRAIGWLKGLHLRLKFLPCEHRRSCRHSFGKKQQPPLLLDCCSRKNTDLFREWVATLQYLAKHVTPCRLKLGFHCLVHSATSARVCLESLQCLPQLAECLIRLPPNASEETAMLARSISLQLRGMSQVPLPRFPRFPDLPVELKLAILRQTELVTPLKEVKYHVRHKDDIRGVYIVQFSGDYCTDGSDEDYSWGSCRPSYHHACRYRPHEHEFCRSYGVFNANCGCWAPPTSLFLASKSVGELAREVFFASNRFVFTPPGHYYGEFADMPHLPLVPFLSQMKGRDALRWLRQMEIVLPAFQEGRLAPHHSALDEWTALLAAVGKELSAPLLTVVLYVATEDAAYTPPSLGRAQREYMLHHYDKYLKIWAQLRGLKAFQVRLINNFPWREHDVSMHFPRHERDNLRARVRETEQGMERLVMGNLSLPRDKRPKCLWPQCFLRHERRHCRNCQQ